MDLHGGGYGGPEMMVAPSTIFCTIGRVGKRSEELARAFGCGLLIKIDEPLKGLLHYEAAMKGIPSIIAESGGEGKVREEDIAVHTQGISNVMKHLGMIEGKLEASEKMTLARFAFPDPTLRVSRAGFLRPIVKPGDVVKKGDVVANVINVFGEDVETLVSPHKGVVSDLRTWASVNAGDGVAWIPIID